MKLFEVITPKLVRACDVVELAIDGLLDGSMDTKVAGHLITGAGRLTQAVGTEVKVRIAAPRIHASEAKQIEGRVVDPPGKTVRLSEQPRPDAEAAE
jgi:hypothetical protein